MVAVVALSVVACTQGRSGPADVPDSGVDGVVVLTGCPAQLAEQTCPVRPAEVDLVVTRAGSGETVARASTAADGRFTILLPPGRYVIDLDRPTAPLPRAEPVLVDVRPSALTPTTITLDSGIR